MPPEVTVLTAVRNGAGLLPETVSSVRAQTFEDWEYVIVDDASDDETPRVLRELSLTDERIRVVRRSEQGGPYAAANEGVRTAKGRYVVRIDGDDLAEAQRIERQLGYLKDTGFRACGSFWQRLVDGGRVIPSAARDASSPRVLKWWYCAGHVVAHSTACFEREAFQEIGGYRELSASQDLRMW
jgi:glycosyltransferase involved in cell wall biosynthesis